ncbi:MAG: transketolase [Planctomycetes bacterium]|nr:transketolase [Planctomycetota bacterium]
MDNQKLIKVADNIRALAAAMPEQAKSGHPGGAMGGADFMAILYTEFLKFDPTDLEWFLRDRFFLDPGHMSPMLYATLSLFGAYSMDDLANFRQWESPTPGHPELEPHRGVENTSGPLGQGHAMGAGAALAERFLAARIGEEINHKTYAYISDGGIQEEISQGVGRIAGHLGLSNFIMFYDSNDIQLSTSTDKVTIEDTKMKYEAWGWRVEVAQGSNFDELRAALKAANSETDRPTLIIGKTIMAKGAVTDQGESFERTISSHGQPLSKAGASFAKTIENLGGQGDNPFQIYPEVAEALEESKKSLTQEAAVRKENHSAWATANPALDAKLKKFISLEMPELDFSAIEQKAGAATRAASKAVLAYLAENTENLIVASADLSNSDNTDGFLNKSKAFEKGDFSGAFFQAGVAELTMAAMMNGIAIHGGVRVAGGTFFVFSDYQKPAARMSALMELPVIYIWTHDAFRVGEDGPTHQPIEQEAQIRLLEKMKNLKGERSLLALRPADVNETTVAWQMALENKSTPSCLILTRQNIVDLPESSYSSALAAKKGAYTPVDCENPDIILVANGSEVSLLVEGAEELKKQGKKVRVVSIISPALFKEQSAEYQESVLPFGVPTLGWTAGLPVNLEDTCGPLGKVIGMTRFGASAPYTVLDEKFGYTAANVLEQASNYLTEHSALVAKIAALNS